MFKALSPSLPLIKSDHFCLSSGFALNLAASWPLPLESGSNLLTDAKIIICAIASAFLGLVSWRLLHSLIILSPEDRILLRVSCIASSSATYNLNCGMSEPTMSVSWSRVSAPNRYLRRSSLTLRKNFFKLSLLTSFHWIRPLIRLLNVSHILEPARSAVLRTNLPLNTFSLSGAHNSEGWPETVLSTLAENRTSALASVWNNTFSTPNSLATVCINLDHADMSESITRFIARSSIWNAGLLNASATNSCRFV